MDASSKAFQFYKSGVLDEDSGCGTKLNHALVIIGQTAKGAKAPEPAEPEQTTTEPETTTDTSTSATQECTVTKWWRNCKSTGGRRLQDAQGEDDYWKAQNSWGTGWGDDGFVKIAIRTGKGVCGMNSYIQYVDWEDSMYK